MQSTFDTANHRLAGFFKYADKYMLPFTLEELRQGKNDPKVQKEMEALCKKLSKPGHPTRPFSAIYYDRNRVGIFYYYGVRWSHDRVSVSTDGFHYEILIIG